MYFAFRWHTYYIKPLQETGTKEEKNQQQMRKKEVSLNAKARNYRTEELKNYSYHIKNDTI